MCRFLIVKSAVPLRPVEWLFRFAEMAERSRSADGDRQGDGWGIGGLDDSGVWRGSWSLRPVWEDETVFAEIPPYRLFLSSRPERFLSRAKGEACVQPTLPRRKRSLCVQRLAPRRFPRPPRCRGNRGAENLELVRLASSRRRYQGPLLRSCPDFRTVVPRNLRPESRTGLEGRISGLLPLGNDGRILSAPGGRIVRFANGLFRAARGFRFPSASARYPGFDVERKMNLC